jgi:hypothetical protein
MLEPCAWWGHVPVYVSGLRQEFFEAFGLGEIPLDIMTMTERLTETQMTDPQWLSLRTWHERQAKNAVEAAIKTYPSAMSPIPEKGFYVVVRRSWAPRNPVFVNGKRRNSGNDGTVINWVEVLENMKDIEIGRRHCYIENLYGPCNFMDADRLCTEFDPYPELFSKVASNLPGRWPEWVKWRRRKRWKPTPQWLVDLRQAARSRKPA